MAKNLFERIAEAKARLGFQAGEECFYRGHADNTWPLLPSLYRHAANANVHGVGLRRLEATLFYEFQARARALHERRLSGWDILSFMRHHGVATRVLDWTEVLGVAFYFAINGNRANTPCIWLLNPYALNTHKHCCEGRDLIAPQYLSDKQNVIRDYDWYLHGDFPEFGWDYPVALYPLQLSDRLHSQSGYFTIHGNLESSLEQLTPSVVQRVDFDWAEVPEIESFLMSAGINTNTLFPDLDGLARHLHEKYRLFQSPQVSVYGKADS